QGKGRLKKLNPNGFFEDFLYANLARYWIHTLGKSGAHPPTKEEVKKITLAPINISKFIRFAEFTSPDDRISYFNRHRAYLWLLLKKEKAFYAPKQDIVKIPMLLLFHEQIKAWVPNAKFLIIIRNPESTIKSSRILTSEASIELYNHYYSFLKQMYDSNQNEAWVLSYDNLLKNPESSTKMVTSVLNATFNAESIELIDPKLIRNASDNEVFSDEYQYLYSQTINKT
ncbi:MAG TPA: hypothetical protein DCS66_18605, partial [Flavobacteriaceae bacterium]|nr:hypothetical protein [Flavobacteriaceae bacterium]